MSQTIYIVLTETGSLLSKAIQLYTQERFNHVSIAFDAELKEMYSFGRKYEHNPWIGGFAEENVRGNLLQYANCAIYAYEVSDEQYRHLRSQIRYFQQNAHLYRYNFLGLLCIACRIQWKRQRAYFCSQFIATLFENARISTNFNIYFIRPTEFAKLPGTKLIYKGLMKHYIQEPNWLTVGGIG